MDQHKALFVEEFKEWATSAAEEWRLSLPGQEFYDEALGRIPQTVQVWVGKGMADGIVCPDGHKFRLRGLAKGKGPYDWFSNYKTLGKLGVNWEWFVHVAEYARLFAIGQRQGMRLQFEDGLMDCAIYKDDQLVVCIETKERADQLRELVAELRKHENVADFPGQDRHNDPLRKAKYIVKHRPRYFAGVAPGLRESFRVEYPKRSVFRLVADFLPPF